MEPPSRKLSETLNKLGLCTQSDLRKCRSRVRSLAQDIPAFDSVWIDALKQIKVITPFQAQILESSEPDQLKIGSFLLKNELGRGNLSTTYLCQGASSSENVVLKRIKLHAEDLQPAFQRLDSEIARLKNLRHPSIVQPARVEVDSESLIAISRNVSGLNLMDLIIRRGRIEPSIVENLVTQLVDALAALESSGGIHGDICLQNIRLTDSGNLVLVDACISPMVFPSLIIDGRNAPEQYEGISPERISGNEISSASSDMFALGTLLWHLLAGRSPFPVGDPIAKLALYQTKRIEDIREWVPDCPVRLANLISQLTEPETANRPHSFQSIRQNWKGSCRSSCKKLARFRASFNQTVTYHSSQSDFTHKRKRGLLVPILMVILFSSTVVLLDEWGFKGELLNISSSIQKYKENHEYKVELSAVPLGERGKPEQSKNKIQTNHNIPQQTLKKNHYLKIPPSNSDGILELKSGVYQAENLSKVGDLVIRGIDSEPSIIMIPPSGFSLDARILKIENIVFQVSGKLILPKSSLDANDTLINLTCQSLEILNSRFDFRLPDGITSKIEKQISWKPLDYMDHRGMFIYLNNSMFIGKGTLIYLNENPGNLVADNCLLLGNDSLVSYPLMKKKSQIRASFKNITLRNSHSVIQLRNENGLLEQIPKSVVIDMKNSVFDLSGKYPSLVQILSNKNPEAIQSGIEMIGEGNLLPPEVPVVSWYDISSNRMKRLDDQEMTIEGLTVTQFKFAGKPTLKWKDSVIKEFDGPRFSNLLPGVELPE